MPTIKVKRGEKVRLVLQRRRRPNQSARKAQTKPRGLILPPDDDDFVAYRKNQQYVNFYDLGAIGAATWADSIAGNLSFNHGQSFSGGHLASNGVTDADRAVAAAALESRILAVPAFDRAATFRKIKKGDQIERYLTAFFVRSGATEIKRFDELAEWTSKGLRFTNQAEFNSLLIAPNSDTFFRAGVVFADAGLKITSEPDFAAPAVAAPPRVARMDVYLMPAFITSGARARYYNGIMTGEGGALDFKQHWEYLNFHYSLFNRAQVGNLIALSSLQPGADGRFYAAEIMRAFAGTRARAVVTRFGALNQIEYEESAGSVSNTPNPQFFTPNGIVEPPDGVPGSEWQAGFGVPAESAEQVKTRLQRIVRANNQWYYFWSTV